MLYKLVYAAYIIYYEWPKTLSEACCLIPLSKQRSSQSILIAQVLCTSQQELEHYLYPELPRSPSFRGIMESEGTKSCFPVTLRSSQHLTLQNYSSQTTKNLRNASVRFSLMLHMAQGKSGHVIMSLRSKSQRSPNESSLLPNNNGASVTSSCYSRNSRQGMLPPQENVKIAFTMPVFHISMRAGQQSPCFGQRLPRTPSAVQR